MIFVCIVIQVFAVDNGSSLRAGNVPVTVSLVKNKTLVKISFNWARLIRDSLREKSGSEIYAGDTGTLVRLTIIPLLRDSGRVNDTAADNIAGAWMALSKEYKGRNVDLRAVSGDLLSMISRGYSAPLSISIYDIDDIKRWCNAVESFRKKTDSAGIDFNTASMRVIENGNITTPELLSSIMPDDPSGWPEPRPFIYSPEWGLWNNIVLSPDGNFVSAKYFEEQNREKCHLIVNNSEFGPFSRVDDPVYSDDGRNYAFKAFISDEEVLSPHFYTHQTLIGPDLPVFSLHKNISRYKYYIYENGREIRSGVLADLSYTAEGLFFTILNEEKNYYLGGKEFSGRYKNAHRISSVLPPPLPGVQGYNGNPVNRIAIKKKGKNIVVMDPRKGIEREYGPYEKVDKIEISDDGKSFAFFFESKKGRYGIQINGREYPVEKLSRFGRIFFMRNGRCLYFYTDLSGGMAGIDGKVYPVRITEADVDRGLSNSAIGPDKSAFALYYKHGKREFINVNGYNVDISGSCNRKIWFSSGIVRYAYAMVKDGKNYIHVDNRVFGPYDVDVFELAESTNGKYFAFFYRKNGRLGLNINGGERDIPRRNMRKGPIHFENETECVARCHDDDDSGRDFRFNMSED